MKWSVVIPFYNNENIAGKILNSLISKIKNESLEVIAVDDASLDRTVEILKTFKDIFKQKNVEFKLIVRHKNGGFSRAVNDGIKKAMGDYVVLINSDVIFKENFFPVLEKIFSRKGYFAVGFLQETLNMGQKIKEGRGRGYLDKGYLLHGKAKPVSGETMWVSGGACAFNRVKLNKIGYFYDIYNPFYWEDLDLSYRALKAGYKIHFTDLIEVSHIQKGGSIRNTYKEDYIKKISLRNQMLFFWINISDLSLLVNHFFHLTLDFIRVFVKGPAWKRNAMIEGFFLLSSALKLRKRNKGLWILKDRDIIRNLTVIR